MGSLNTKSLSLRRTFATHFTVILGSSILATFLTWGIMLILFSYLFNKGIFLPANYYEQKIPVITEYVQTDGELFLTEDGQDELEKIIPLEGMSYKVVALTGEDLYGNLEVGEKLDARKIMNRLNQTASEKNGIIKYIPILSSKGKLLGTLLLGYSLKVSATNPTHSPLLRIGFLPFFLTPFLFIVFFTYIFGRRFSRKVSAPLQDLMHGAERIKERDLHFSMKTNSSITEVNQLTLAFEEMRQELQQSLEREWKLEQDRKTMFAALAHDLRTPLTIIQGHVEGLEEHHQEISLEKLRQYIQAIKNNTKRAANLLKDMNTITEIEKVSFQLQPISIPLKDFVEEKTAEYEMLCNAKKICFTSDIIVEQKLGSQDSVTFDPYRIAQILDNLVANSIRFTPAKGSISWRIELTDQHVTMAITDNGTGFLQHDLQHVFDPFFQGHSRSSRQKGHAGLGLYIAKLLIQHHNGQILAKNNATQGATVQFKIPLTSP